MGRGGGDTPPELWGWCLAWPGAYLVPGMVGVVPSWVGVVPSMVGVVPSLVGVVPSMVGVVPGMVTELL